MKLKVADVGNERVLLQDGALDFRELVPIGHQRVGWHWEARLIEYTCMVDGGGCHRMQARVEFFEVPDTAETRALGGL